NMLVQSFGYTHGMNIVISSSSNNYGPRQHEEKLIPTIISSALNGKEIPIYGDGQNIRDGRYVRDHCIELNAFFHHGEPMATYNVGGRNEKTNLQVATEICTILDQIKADIKAQAGLKSFQDLITFTEDRLGHDRRYAVDDTKLRTNLG